MIVRQPISPVFPFGTLLLSLAAEAGAQPTSTDASRFSLGIEIGPVWFSRNDVRIPGTTGTEFDMTDLTGSGPDLFARVDGSWRINDRHGVRFVLAPLEITGSGMLLRDTDFAGATFPAGPTHAAYQFNAYKLTYRYTLRNPHAWLWRVGFTGIVRDANIELTQGELQANDDNVGFVPALHVSGEYAFAERWKFLLDFDGLAGGPGRLFDVAVRLDYELNEDWRIGGGYRFLEGGADTDDVYNFAWLHYAVLSLEYSFGRN